MKSDLTCNQARDLARYLLGADVDTTATPNSCAIMRGSTVVGIGYKWRDAFRSADVKWPARPQYVAKGRKVMLGSEARAEACSNTFANTIATALNAHDREST